MASSSLATPIPNSTSLAGGDDTWIYNINDAGDFGGTFDNLGRTKYYGFVNLGGTTTSFLVPGSYWTSPSAINIAGETVGNFYYQNGDTYSHGFFRDTSGTITSPLDIAPGTDTYLSGLNDSDQIVGSYGTYRDIHGLLMNLSGSYITYDYPGAEITSLNGINNAGLICGSYGGRVNHGFIARVVR